MDEESSKRLERRVVAVTDAGRGIGRGYALALAREGARVVVNDLGTNLEAQSYDKTTAAAVVEEIRSEGGEAIARESAMTEEDVLRRSEIQSADNLAPLAVCLCSEATLGISGQIFQVHGDRIVQVSPPRRGAEIERPGDHWNFDAFHENFPRLIL